MIRRLIQVDGTVTDYPNPMNMREIAKLIGCDGVDTVVMRHMGTPMHVLIVDDIGLETGKAVNAIATDLYRINCIPGTKRFIVGDVFLAPDSDFA